MTTTIDPKTALKLYQDMVLIREFEEALDRLFASGVIRGTAHFCVGQEATAVGVSGALEDGDYVISYHRGHGHFLAQGGDPRRIMAELYGKQTGYSGGRGGSQHVSCLDVGFLGSNGITGGGMPIGTGAALALKMQGKNGVVVVFFGDGAANQGAFHESINLAAVWKLPVLFVCENNLYSMFTHISETTAVEDISRRADAYDIAGEQVNGNDVQDVLACAERAILRARAGEGPTLIECKTYRQLGHSKSDQRAYRTREEEAEWENRDPIASFRNLILSESIATEEELAEKEQEVEQLIEESIKYAEESPLPSPDDLETSVFAD
ncbi:MAG: thiamine pyrophosphate-dependent dehydrogenase E1 component subunit alpha [Planctomycetota bacterium]|jgi:pyruvate dehydrogenase E1 component alpha subunit|nr:thiamine pyrophosphate-dependent dehydrogenase E1 component subunit alpha [Planctomycetota bacterium]MDP6502678.1 thiamine pyrophosphate-dependent dehydrogenase E1 component subunit alpha [Planctomycetota bacterium]